ncbi:MAG: alpha/beta hydrolase [Firmicutes bacterium]|jgi:pimeloyl-[acyl-carrier protein] methyl ester esterase|nr:alpha/beta hydrolase [Bacillota bacterium]
MIDIIIISGWGDDGSLWENTINEFSSSYKTHFIDINIEGNFEKQLEKVNNYIDDKKIIKPIILAWSMGSILAIRLASKVDISALVLIGATGSFVKRKEKGSSWSKKDVEIMKNNLLRNKNKQMRNFMKLSGAYGDILKDYADLKTVEELISGLDVLIDTNVIQDAKKIKCSTLLIHGEKDKIVPLEKGKELSSIIEGSKLIIYENCGHIPFWDEEERFIFDLVDFISNLNKE